MICRSNKVFCRWVGNGLAWAVIIFTWLTAINASAVDEYVAPRLSIGQNENGQLEVFRVGPEGDLWHRWRKASNGAWSSWSSLGGSLFSGVTIVTNGEGQMEVFAVDRSSHAFECIYQSTTNSLSWSSWTNPGGACEPPVAVGQNPDGRLEVFAVDATRHGVRHVWQTDLHGGWSGWSALDGSFRPGLMVARNRDGRLELFGLAADDVTLRHCWQLQPDTTNDWSGWAGLGGTILPQLTCFLATDAPAKGTRR